MHAGKTYMTFIFFPNNRMNLFQEKDNGKQGIKYDIPQTSYNYFCSFRPSVFGSESSTRNALLRLSAIEIKV